MVTFGVDDVTPAAERLPVQSVGELFPAAVVVGGDPALPVVVPDGVHPLLSAVGRAFAEHRRLVLSPDAVWLTIAQGIAQHVRLHAEQLRPRLVTMRDASDSLWLSTARCPRMPPRGRTWWNGSAS